MITVPGLTAAWQAFLENADQDTPYDCAFFYNGDIDGVEYAGVTVGLNKGWVRIPVPYTAVDLHGAGEYAPLAGFLSRLTADQFECWIKRWKAKQKEVAHA